jgi:hypothetical protein
VHDTCTCAQQPAVHPLDFLVRFSQEPRRRTGQDEHILMVDQKEPTQVHREQRAALEPWPRGLSVLDSPDLCPELSSKVTLRGLMP